MSGQEPCPLCFQKQWPGKATRFVLDGVTHSAPTLWLVGSVDARDAADPHTSALEHYRDAMEAWVEQCEARRQQ